MTERDEKVVEFITRCPCFSNTIQSIFYPSQRVANRRLDWLFDYGYLKRTRDHASEHYFYYTGREPKQKQHFDYIAKAYNWILQQGYKILYFDIQKQRENIIPDMVCVLEKNDKVGTLAIEVELSNNCIDKKIKLYESSKFKKLLLISTKNVTSNYIEIINLNKGDLG